ncbi:MAG TPA: hypothetical protein VFV50_19545 [Bdellovibrionales bacterium]|nr:hypothetical protein [Bdellovibrionales bacterium]
MKLMLSLLAALALASPARAQTPDNAELSRKIDILTEEVNRLKQGESAAAVESPVRTGLGESASKVYRTSKGVSIGGYGEMLYQNYANEKDNGSAVTTPDKIDFLRAVMYFGYRFNEKFLLNTELEFEHASTGKGGEVSVEFAYIDYLMHPMLNVRAGILLHPMGLVNELHEPTTFLGARRPDTENAIIPTTWRENGFGLFGDVGAFSYRTYILNGLNADGFSATGLRNGRQKGAEAKADRFSWVARLDYLGVEGLIAGVAAYIGQSSYYPSTGSGANVPNVDTSIYDVHVDYKLGAWEFRALAALAQLDHVPELNAAKSLTGANSVGTRLTGQYAQVGYDVLAGRDSAFIPFVRWEQLDTQAEVPAGFSRSDANNAKIMTYGFSYKPLDQIVVKVDYQDYERGDGSGVNQYNALLGYVF